MSKSVRVSLIVLTALAWVAVALTATPGGHMIDPAIIMLARPIAITGSIASLVCRTQPDVDELLRIGKALGRAEAQREAADASVIRLDDRRRLRAVDD